MLKAFRNPLFKKQLLNPLKFSFCSEAPQREQMQYDVLIVGGGPAGLATAIKLKQLETQKEKPISVCVIEKGSEIGNVFQPKAFDELIPDWRKLNDDRPPIDTIVTKDEFLFLRNEKNSIKIPHALLPSTLHNAGSNYIISLGNLCQWMGRYAENLGVDIFPATPGAQVLYSSENQVIGVLTKEMGIDKSNKQKDNYQDGIEILAKQTIFAEGARGSLSEEIIDKYELRKNSDPQTYIILTKFIITYGIGLKEVWEVDNNPNFHQGLVQHALGWPLNDKTYGGSFMYHMAINAGGYYALPKLTFPGGMLVGCSAGFLNVFKIKGTHNAIKSGMLSAESLYEKVTDENYEEGNQLELQDYEKSVKDSWIYSELKRSRNVKGAFKYGKYAGMINSGLIEYITKGYEPWSFRYTKKDCDNYDRKIVAEKINYPKHDGVLTFDLLENLQRSGTYHDHDQPSHLKIKKSLESRPKASLNHFDGPEQRFCPAKVYEFVEDDQGKKVLQINAQNCLHCKTCSIKMVDEYIDWTVPEGGGGPNYAGM